MRSTATGTAALRGPGPTGLRVGTGEPIRQERALADGGASRRQYPSAQTGLAVIKQVHPVPMLGGGP